MLRMTKLALIAMGTIGALASPIAASAQQGVDWEGYERCRDDCWAAFPGRERECERSCGEQYGVDFGDGGPAVTPGGDINCSNGRCGID